MSVGLVVVCWHVRVCVAVSECVGGGGVAVAAALVLELQPEAGHC